MTQKKIVVTSGDNGQWWELQERDSENLIPGIETWKRLGVFSDLAALNDYIFRHKINSYGFAELAIDSRFKETR